MCGERNVSVGQTGITRRMTSFPGSAPSAAQAVALCLALAGPCAAAAAAPSTPKAQTPASESAASHELVLQIQWYPQAQFAGYMIAQDKGLFRKAGLPDVKLLWSKPGDRPLDGVAEGQADFCTGWLSEGIVERAAGKPLVHITQVFQHSSMMLVTRSNSGIATPADMTGKRVGLWGGNCDVPVLAFFAKYQVRPTIIPQSASMVPFLRSAVDVASAMRYNEYHKLLEAGVRPEELRVFALADYGMAFPEDGLYCSQRTRHERPETCAALVAACREGWDYALEHEAETLEVVMRQCQQANVRTNRNHQQWMLRSVATAIRGRPGDRPAPWGSLSREVYQGVGKALVDQRLIRQTPAFDEFHRPPERQ